MRGTDGSRSGKRLPGKLAGLLGQLRDGFPQPGSIALDPDTADFLGRGASGVMDIRHYTIS